MTAQAGPKNPIQKIIVRVQVGDHRMAGSDDPFFLRLVGPCGREFRLKRAKGKSFRKGRSEEFVFGSPSDSATNVAAPDLNDPTRPALDASQVEHIAIQKAMEPIPNVRGVGEMDDRLELSEIEVELHAEGLAEARRFYRAGPLWLGLASGLRIDIGPVDGDS